LDITLNIWLVFVIFQNISTKNGEEIDKLKLNENTEQIKWNKTMIHIYLI